MKSGRPWRSYSCEEEMELEKWESAGKLALDSQSRRLHFNVPGISIAVEITRYHTTASLVRI